MAKRRKDYTYEPPIPDDELALRMSSSAARKLEERLESVGWTGERILFDADRTKHDLDAVSGVHPPRLEGPE